MVRAVVVAVRALVTDFVPRDVLTAGEIGRAVFDVRDTVFFVVVRAVVFFCALSAVRVVVLLVSRDTEFMSRTAASAMPIPKKSVVIMYIYFRILDVI